MAVTVTERPYKFSFAANDIRYIFNISDPASAGVGVEIELYYLPVTAGGAGTLLKGFELTPDSAGVVYCHISDYLSSVITPELPALQGSLVQPVSEQIKSFYIKYREVTTAAPDPAWITDARRFVLMGGVEQMKLKGNNFFTNYLPTQKAFLTWQPGKHFVYQDQPHYLTFLRTTAGAFDVNVKTVFTDGTVDTSKTVNVAAGADLLFRIDAAAEVWGLHLIAPAKQIYYYEISVVRGGDVLANPYRYYIEYRPLYSYWDILFFNSISGLDAVRVTGETTISIETTADDIERITGNDVLNTETPRCQFSQVNFQKRDNYKGDAGWQRTIQQQEALIELLVSKARYEVLDGRWIEVINLKETVDLRNTNDKKWSFPVEWSYAFSDSVFTPKSTMLGNGSNIDTTLCDGLPAPVNVQITVNATSPGSTVTYTVTWGYDVAYTFGDIELYTSIDDGATWQSIADADYDFGQTEATSHMVKVVVRCPFDNTVVNEATDTYLSVCTPVAIPGGISMPDAEVGQPYIYSFTLTGSAPFTFSNIVKPAWMTISLVGHDLTLSGDPDAEATDVAVSFTVNNCSTDTADFADTINVTAAAPPAAETRFGNTTFVSSDASGDFEVAYIEGPAGASVTVKLVEYSNDNSNGLIQVNNDAAFLYSEWTFVFGAGGFASFDVSVTGEPTDGGTMVRGLFQIVSVSAGTIGAPDTFLISKAF